MREQLLAWLDFFDDTAEIMLEQNVEMAEGTTTTPTISLLTASELAEKF